MGKEQVLRKLLVIALTAMTVAGTSSIALAATTIQWTGQGGENLPCDGGGHWVLTGKGVTSATMDRRQPAEGGIPEPYRDLVTVREDAALGPPGGA